ncbi:unnamed protein product, partial [Hymenolepis diminuta]|uniref:Sema domain-containing protein n=1 Tax=Hymenolepis diminuta TaxID=6216 RepID=A0A0R3SBB0_HYMDI
GEFSIAACLFANGTILFAYKEVPQLNLLSGQLQGCHRRNYTSDIREERNSQKDVVVGISDAYLYDVKELSVFIACVEQTTCSDCLGDKVKGFQCQWCPQIRTCSSGVDRGLQRWRDNDCHLNVSEIFPKNCNFRS